LAQQGRQVLDHNAVDDGVLGAAVVVNLLVPHAGDLRPGDRRICVLHRVGQLSACFTDNADAAAHRQEGPAIRHEVGKGLLPQEVNGLLGVVDLVA